MLYTSFTLEDPNPILQDKAQVEKPSSDRLNTKYTILASYKYYLKETRTQTRHSWNSILNNRRDNKQNPTHHMSANTPLNRQWMNIKRLRRILADMNNLQKPNTRQKKHR